MSIENSNTQDFIPLEAFGASCDPVLFIKKDVDKGEIKDLLTLKLEYARALAAVMNANGFGAVSETTRASYMSALGHLTAECSELATLV